MIMKNWEDFPYYILSTALTFEKVCLKRQKCISCCQDRGVDPEQPPWICNSGGQMTFTLQNKIITKQQGLRFDKFLQDSQEARATWLCMPAGLNTAIQHHARVLQDQDHHWAAAWWSLEPKPIPPTHTNPARILRHESAGPYGKSTSEEGIRQPCE